VNYSEDVYRQRFTAAHELAHAIFDSDDSAVVSFAAQIMMMMSEYEPIDSPHPT